MGQCNSRHIGQSNEKELLLRAAPHQGGILDVSYTETSGEIVCASDDHSLSVFNWNKPSSSSADSVRMVGHNRAVNRLDVSGDHVWSCSRDRSLRQWSKSTGECLRTIENAHELTINGLAIR